MSKKLLNSNNFISFFAQCSEFRIESFLVVFTHLCLSLLLYLMHWAWKLLDVNFCSSALGAHAFSFLWHSSINNLGLKWVSFLEHHALPSNLRTTNAQWSLFYWKLFGFGRQILGPLGYFRSNYQYPFWYSESPVPGFHYSTIISTKKI